MPLITVTELEAFMGKDFTASETTQAESIIQQVEYFIEDEAGVSLTHYPNDIIVIQADGHGIIELDKKPVNSVSSVTDVDGNSLDCWEFDGLSAVYGLFPNQVVILTYDHGFETVPGRLKGVALGVASRVMYNPSGLRQETVGAISVTYPGIGGEAGTINFTDLERKTLERYAGIGKSLRLNVNQRRIASLPVLTLDNAIH